MAHPIAADIMNTAPRTCSSFSSVIEAVLIFKDQGTNMVPVVEEGKLLGVVTSRDLALAIENRADLSVRPVSEFMTREFHAMPPETPLSRVSHAFLAEGVRYLPVVDAQGDFLGVIGWNELTPYLVYQAEGATPLEVEEPL
jgi:CBS domain-containing protein